MPQIFAPDSGEWRFWLDLGLVQISALALSIKNLRVPIEIFWKFFHTFTGVETGDIRTKLQIIE